MGRILWLNILNRLPMVSENIYPDNCMIEIWILALKDVIICMLLVV